MDDSTGGVAAGTVNGTPNSIVIHYTVASNGNYSNPGTDWFGLYDTGFFVGATARVYRLVNNQYTLIRTNTVTGYTAVPLSTNPADHTITLDSNGPDVHNGDLLWLSKDNDITAAHSFSFNDYTDNTDGTESIAHVTDGPPGDTFLAGRNSPVSLQVTGTSAETYGIKQGSTANTSLDTYENFLTGNTYEVDVWLKQSGIGDGSVTFRDDLSPSLTHTWTGVNSQWQKFTYQFPAPTNISNGGYLHLDFNGPGTLSIDRWQLFDASHPVNTPDPQMLQSFQNFQPGTLRLWADFQSGGGGYARWGLDAWLAPEDKKHVTRSDVGTKGNLPDELALCTQVGANPWLIVNLSLDEQEWSHLIDYLCAPAGSGGYASFRPADHPGPYTADFPTIYIEFGNEEWGTDGAEDGPIMGSYGQYAHYLLSKATANPNFDASKIKFILNDATPIPGYSTFGSGGIAVAPEASLVDYFNYINGSGTGDDYYQSELLALPNSYQGQINNWMNIEQTSAAQGRPYTVACYEGGPGSDDPNNGGKTGDHSLAAAVSTLDVDLYGSSVGVGPQNFFVFNATGSQGRWSSHTLFSEGFRPNPVWEALQMRNQLCAGDVVATDTNADPTSGQSPLIGTYVFHNGNSADIVVISRDLNNATPVTLHLPVNPNGPATLTTLTGDPRANNDSALSISPQTQKGVNFTRDYTFTMPAGSVYVYQVPTDAWPVAGPSGLTATAPLPYTVQLNWSALSGATSYNLYRSTTPGGEGTTPYKTGIITTAFTDTGLLAGTTYYYKISAVVSGSESDTSNQASATPYAPTTDLEINCGGAAVAGTGWVADTDFSGGNTYGASGSVDTSYVSDPAPQDVYLNERYCLQGQSFGYTFTHLALNTAYTLRLHFNAFGGDIVDSVSINGTLVMSNVDIAAAAGGYGVALVKEFTATSDSSGSISLVFANPGAGSYASIEGIELHQAAPIAVVQINCGGSAVAGTGWVADTDFSGGNTYGASGSVDTSQVSNPAAHDVYRNERYCLQNQSFGYTLPGLTPGQDYLVRLHFNAFGGDIVDNVSINGASVMSNVDIAAAAGGYNVAMVREFVATADATGSITITFSNPGAGSYASIEGIELYQVAPSVIAQINCGGSAVSGTGWVADTDFSGGNTYGVTHNVDTSHVTNPAPLDVYRNERYCLQGQSFGYTIPGLTAGRNYTVRLHFNAFDGDIVDDVTINGVSVMSGVDIASAAGGYDVALVKEYTAIADSSGNISLVFANPGVGNYASIEGIEILGIH